MTAGPPASSPSSPAAEAIRAIAVIGAGHAGRDFALRCASAGFHVTLEDVMPARLRRAEEIFATQPSAGTLHLAATVEDAVRSADLAIDFVPDELESKLEIFSMIDRMAPPRTALLTPTETLSITDLASCTYRPSRCLALRGTLAANSGQPTRLVVPPAADPTLVAAIEAFLRTLGLQPQPEPDADLPSLIRSYL